MVEKIESMIRQLETMTRSGTVVSMAPSIIKSLKHLIELLTSDQPNPKLLRDEAYGLGRLVMDDFLFSESPFGTELMSLSTNLMKTVDEIN